MTWLAPLLLLSAPVAQAETVCAPLTEDDFYDDIAAAQQALIDADIEAHERVMTGLQARIPCFAFIPKPEQWAELLVGVAIVEHATGGKWEAPLTTALSIHPRVNRMVGSKHPLSSWQPPPPPEPSGVAVPEGIRIYFDGELVSEVPTDTGYHLAQRRTGDGLVTELLIDEAIPAEWLDVPELGFAVDAGWGLAGVSVGGAGSSLSVPDAGTFLTSGGAGGLGLSAGAHGVLRFGDTWGMRYDLGVGVMPNVGGEVTLGAALAGGSIAPWFGAWLSTAAVQTADGSQGLVVAAPALGVASRSGAVVWTARAAVAPWVVGGELDGALVLGEGLAPYIGLGLQGHQLLLSQGPDRKLSQFAWTAALQVGVSWGGAE